MGQEGSGGGQEWEDENRVWLVRAWTGWCVEDGGERRRGESVCAGQRR